MISLPHGARSAAGSSSTSAWSSAPSAVESTPQEHDCVTSRQSHSKPPRAPKRTNPRQDSHQTASEAHNRSTLAGIHRLDQLAAISRHRRREPQQHRERQQSRTQCQNCARTWFPESIARIPISTILHFISVYLLSPNPAPVPLQLRQGSAHQHSSQQHTCYSACSTVAEASTPSSTPKAVRYRSRGTLICDTQRARMACVGCAAIDATA